MNTDSKLAAFKIDRRLISVAIFINDRLDFTDSRQLHGLYSKALETAKAYIEWLMNALPVDSAAFEKIRGDPKTFRNRLQSEIISQLRNRGIPVFEIETDAVISSYSHPPLKYRTELRNAVTQIWPILASGETQA